MGPDPRSIIFKIEGSKLLQYTSILKFCLGTNMLDLFKPAKLLSKIKKILMVHIDLPTIIMISVIVLVIHRPLASFIFTRVAWLSERLDLPIWIGPILQGVSANIITALIVGPFLYFFFRNGIKSQTVGKFSAYDISDGKRTEWGTVHLTYNLFSNRIIGKIVHNDIILKLEASFDKGDYLRGHYNEESNRARRRLGAFLLQLNGQTDKYIGPFVFVDPEDDNIKPKSGTVEWERLSD